jgi:hypothetical protein
MKGLYHLRAVRNFYVRTGAILGAMILAVALASGAPATAAPLGQAGTGTVTGTVTSLDNVPLAGVKLSAYNQDPSVPNRTPLVQTQSDAQGKYSVQVPAGTIWMQFETQDVLGQSFWGYSNKPIQVAAGQTVTGQDFVVAIRVVKEPPTAAPPTATAVPPTAAPPTATAVPPTEVPPTPMPPVTPGMPTTGAGPDLRLPLIAVVGLLLVLAGLVQRRRASR